MSKQIDVIFFGKIAELMNEKKIQMDNIYDTGQLLNHLKSVCPQLEQLVISIAVNKKIISQETILNDGDEVAIMPPFSGG